MADVISLGVLTVLTPQKADDLTQKYDKPSRTGGLGCDGHGSGICACAGFSALLSRFSRLAFSPYPVFCAACFLAGRGGRAFAALVVCALATSVAIFFYTDLFLECWIDERVSISLGSSYQLPAAILLVIVISFCRLRERRLTDA